jgi:hypothetical protein
MRGQSRESLEEAGVVTEEVQQELSITGGRAQTSVPEGQSEFELGPQIATDDFGMRAAEENAVIVKLMSYTAGGEVAGTLREPNSSSSQAVASSEEFGERDGKREMPETLVVDGRTYIGNESLYMDHDDWDVCKLSFLSKLRLT